MCPLLTDNPLHTIRPAHDVTSLSSPILALLPQAHKLRSGAFTRSKIVSATTCSGSYRVPFRAWAVAVTLPN